VNDWIRAKKRAEGLIDFDKLLEDPNDSKHINPTYDCGDHLHPNDKGYQAMAKAGLERAP
jgi:lysophospholipase L1-like esterase